jgi:transcription-repair coupling factor (superfamily II helicase)
MIKLFINQLKLQLKKYHVFKKILTHIRESALPLTIRGVNGGFFSLINTFIFHELDRHLFLIVDNELRAEEIFRDISLFIPDKVMLFPCWNTHPYSRVSSSTEVYAGRVKVLAKLLQSEPMLVILTARALLTRLPPVESLKTNIITVKTGDVLEHDALISSLQELGYTRVPRVSVKTEFAVRGEVIDIFIPGYEQALRIVLDFDRIDSLRFFDPHTQLSLHETSRVSIYPLREMVLNKKTKSSFKKNLMARGYENQVINEFLERVTLNPELNGLEYILALFFNSTSAIMDYCSIPYLLVLDDDDKIENRTRIIQSEYNELYAKTKSQDTVAAEPADLLQTIAELKKRFPYRINFSAQFNRESAHSVITLKSDPARSFFGNINYFKQELNGMRAQGYEIFIFAGYKAQADYIGHLLKDYKLTIIPETLSSGFCLPEGKLWVIAENEIFKRKKRKALALKRYETQIIDSFIELEQGDYIVHVQHGIGMYKGIERIKAIGFERDYIRLEYAEKEFIFIPTEQVNLIQRYIASGNRRPKLDKIGGKAWLNRKNRVKHSVEELAASLLKLYAVRRDVQGISFLKDSEWQAEFEAGFPYDETPDQLKCIADVKRDMESFFPMERLICGDVGYGKTEIALRAAFKAVMSGKQVALLAPTTILVEQHFETFAERFKNFPVQIDMLSRFVEKREQRKIVHNIAMGKTDVIIGTHRLLQKDVRFKNIGLLIIDEEQRFGVKHKEKIKQLKTNIDCLILTATPIPRTLYMSLAKIKDMSLINTPPLDRLPIETFVMEFNEKIIKDVIQRETERGGQVFFLHNRVQTIAHVYNLLSQLVPGLRVAVAHGKMESHELEDVMHEFVNKNHDILLSTTIIENGIDIPNVNTIIIDRADMMGISQLYQLRGRVGRSSVPAFAYLLYPGKQALTETAMRRLKIISNYTELGSGFKIALKDLELRGAGNLLGREQHGDILAVGFEMYMKLLDEAIALQDKENLQEQAPELFLELEYSGYIPDLYIDDMIEKMEVYKKIASITTEQDLERIYKEVEDRFGPLPDELHSILSIAEIRIICRKLFISSIREKKAKATVTFSKLSLISTDKVLRLLKESGGAVFLDSKKPQCLFLRTGNIGLKEKSEFIKEKLSFLL